VTLSAPLPTADLGTNDTAARRTVRGEVGSAPTQPPAGPASYATACMGYAPKGDRRIARICRCERAILTMGASETSHG
jgi:hypothetical protein